MTVTDEFGRHFLMDESCKGYTTVNKDSKPGDHHIFDDTAFRPDDDTASARQAIKDFVHAQAIPSEYEEKEKKSEDEPEVGIL